MKKTFNTSIGSRIAVLLIALTFFSCNCLFAQSGWLPVYTESQGGFQWIFFSTINTGYAVGGKWIGSVPYPSVVRTTDAGSTWLTLTTPLSDSANMIFRCVLFTDVNTGFMTSSHFTNTLIGNILKTTNGGINWTKIPMDRQMTRIYFISPLTGFATGYQRIFKTTNIGSSWEVSSYANSGAYLFSIHFISANSGYVAGNLGWLYKTTDCGVSWGQQQPQNYQTSLWDVWFINSNTGFVVGGNSNNTGNKIFRTIDAGISWDSIIHPLSDGALFSVRFVNSLTGFITGTGQILKTTNGGSNWYFQYLPLPDSSNLTSGNCFFTNEYTGYAVFHSPQHIRYILKTTTGGEPLGIKPISNEVPSRFSLYQNYPNPFNPTTGIKFAIPKSSMTNLVVYDILGREIAALVNEELKPGTYEVEWDGSNHPSGVYFCKIKASEFTDVKKMILVK